MLSVIPPIVAFTIFLGWILFSFNGSQTDKTDGIILGENMVRYSQAVATDIESSGSPPGVFNPAMPPPFNELTDWTSEVVIDAVAGTKFLLTWPANYVSTAGTGDGWTESDYGYMLSGFAERGLARSEVGRWQPNGDGSGKVNEVNVPILASTIPDRAPTIVYRLN